MQRYDIINSLIKKYNYKKYLEIGVQGKVNWNKVECEYKVGVDPDINVKTTFNLTSDDFFKQNKEKFDIIFIDGMHIDDYVYRDITNSLNCLNENGTIITHDTIPFDEPSQKIPRETKKWTGNCWKAFVKLRWERNDLQMFTVDTDCGCGVIRRGYQEKILDLVDDYKVFEKNKNYYLNIISVEGFKVYLNED